MIANPISPWRTEIHHHLLERYDLARLQRLPAQQQWVEVRHWVSQFLVERRPALNAPEQEQLIQDIQNEMLGYGPLEPWLADPQVSDILVNGPDQVYVERAGRLERVPTRFNDEGHLARIIERIVSRVGRRIDESSPMVDARLPDGSRVNAIIAPLSLSGSILSIRRFVTNFDQPRQWLEQQALTQPMCALLQSYVQARLNVLICGATGSGKTTLLNMLAAFIDPGERLITIEDAAELQLPHSHVIRLETRAPNLEGAGAVSAGQLVRNALRMRPDRLILGEVRGAEALDMLQAMNTGHEGSLCTLHANSAPDALVRLEQMAGQADHPWPERIVRAQLASALHVVVHIGRLPDGQRKILAICELQPDSSGGINCELRWRYRPRRLSRSQSCAGEFECLRPESFFAERLALYAELGAGAA